MNFKVSPIIKALRRKAIQTWRFPNAKFIVAFLVLMAFAGMLSGKLRALTSPDKAPEKIVDQQNNLPEEFQNMVEDGKCIEAYKPASTFTFNYEPKTLILPKDSPIMDIVLREQEYVERQSASQGTITAYAGSLDLSKIVYITTPSGIIRDLYKNSPITERVYALDIETNERVLLYEYEAKVSPTNPEFMYQLIDIAFVNNSQIIITRSDAILKYDLNTKNLITLYSNEPFRSRGVGGVFGYADPIFNDNQTKFIATLYYYEGRDSGIFSVADNSYSVPFGTNSMSEQTILIGWYKDKLIAQEEKYREDYNGIDITFYLVDPDTNEKETLFSTNKGADEIIKYIDNKIFFTDNTSASGSQTVCDKEYTPSLQVLNMFDLASRKMTKLLEMDSTKYKGESYFESKVLDFNFYTINGEKHFFLKLDRPGYAKTMAAASEPFLKFYNSISDGKAPTKLFSIDLQKPNHLMFVKYTYDN